MHGEHMPVTEAIAKKWLEQECITNVHVESAGTEAIRPAQNAVAITRRSRSPTISWKTRTFTFCTRTNSTLALDGSPVEDPFGRDLAEYALMETYVHQRMRELFPGQF